MGLLSRFISKNSFLLLFLFLEGLSLFFIFSQNSLQRSWIAAQFTAVNSWVNGYINQGTSYLRLKEDNQKLINQNKQLMLALYGKSLSGAPQFRKVYDTLGGGQIFTIVSADVMYNSINKKNNYFTINKGIRDGISPGMAVTAPNGIAGIVINTTASYALAQSILSQRNIKISTAIKNSGYFGNITWDGIDSRLMHLHDIPKYVPISIGDTIVTDGRSAIFPQGVMVGRIAGYEVDTKTGFWDIAVHLSEPMGKLSKVYVVKNLKKAEIRSIQDTLQVQLKKDDE